MSEQCDFFGRPAFEIRCLEETRAPFIFNSPHSGRHYPEGFMRQSRLDATTIRRSEDAYVDELFAEAAATLGAPLLHANFPRAYLDVNREPYELDPCMFHGRVPGHVNTRSIRVAGGLGTIPRLVAEGLEIYRGSISIEDAMSRVENLYRPYHESLCRLISRTHARFGHAVLIDCHSMPASAPAGDSRRRPDFIIGDRFGTSASRTLSKRVCVVLRSMGYDVARNQPYAGGFITQHYGRPALGIQALQIEVNRGLYMNEQTYGKTAGFDALCEDMARFSNAIADIGTEDRQSLPVAAE